MGGIEVSIVIPVYNERENLPEMVRRTLSTCRSMKRSFEIIFVDDGSKDGSREILHDVSHESPEIKTLVLNRNYGQHAAIFAGFEQSKGNIVITLDADLQNPPEEIPNLMQEIEKGFDVVGTVRQNRQDSWFRRKVSALANKVAQRTTGVMMHDFGCMLRAYRRSVVDAMLRCEEHSLFIPVLANSFAGSTSEIPVKHSARVLGDSKYGILKLISYQFDLLTSTSTFHLRLLSLFGMFFSALGVLLAVLRIALGALWDVAGVFTLLSILSIFIGAQFIGLGFLGEYIERIYHDVRNRPRFLVKEIYDFGRSDPEK